MKAATRWLLVLILCGAACGKVGEPQPPFIRIPQPVTDLAVRQNGNQLILTWTNPARNIDGSAATDLSRVHIRSGEATIATIDVSAPAEMQSHSMPAGNGARTFTLTVETTRGKKSDASNIASITPVEVPGRVTALEGIPDQRRIILMWKPPREHPELVDTYLVQRIQPPADPEYVNETHYEDSRYQPGQTYTYEVTAVRRVQGSAIPGIGPEPIRVTAEDHTPPQIPTDVDISATDTGAFVTWSPNSERDLAGYRVYRSGSTDGEFVRVTQALLTTNAYFDPDYKSGLYYAVSAVDEFGNESAKSRPIR